MRGVAKPRRRGTARAPISCNGLSVALAAPHPWVWAVTLAIAVIDGVWLASLGIVLEPLGFMVIGGLVALLLAAAAFWSLVRPEPTLRTMALATATLLAFTIAVAVLHYLAATLGRPLVDQKLAAVEAALRFDWLALVAFLEAHPMLARGLALAYHSSGPQVAVVVIALSAARRLRRLWRFVRMFVATLLVVIVISSLLPAVGPYAYYAAVEGGTARLETIGATWHLEPLAGLRSGGVAGLALSDIRGLATFPSFHVCLALITAWALAPIPFLGPLALALNVAVIAGTITAGGHYLPDLLAGGALGVIALFYTTKMPTGRMWWPSYLLAQWRVAAYSAATPARASGTRSMMRPG